MSDWSKVMPNTLVKHQYGDIYYVMNVIFQVNMLIIRRVDIGGYNIEDLQKLMKKDKQFEITEEEVKNNKLKTYMEELAAKICYEIECPLVMEIEYKDEANLNDILKMLNIGYTYKIAS